MKTFWNDCIATKQIRGMNIVLSVAATVLALELPKVA